MRKECYLCLKFIDEKHYQRHLRQYHKLRPSWVEKLDHVIERAERIKEGEEWDLAGYILSI